MIDIPMPRLSDTMEEGTIAAWHKKPGDLVSPGDVIVEIETDKAVMEHEAYELGTLASILVPEGESVAIGTPIARLDDGTGEDVPAPQDTSAAEASTATEITPIGSPAESSTASDTKVRSTQKTVHPRATPLVRKLARERGIDLTAVSGTGPGGRIVRADIPAAPESAPDETGAATTPAQTGTPANDAEVVPFDPIRQAIGTRLTQSATTTPTFTATASADVEALFTLRADLNAALDGTGDKVSINDLVMRAVALALREHPRINASYSPAGRGQTLMHKQVNVGVAVAAPAGLMVPVVHNTDRLAVSAIGTRIRTLSAKAMDRALSPDDMSDGTFTVSNLGMFGVENFTAIINPPQGAILAVGAALPETRLVDGAAVERRRMRYTITADHRIIDGADAGRFLAGLTELLENPLRLLA